MKKPSSQRKKTALSGKVKSTSVGQVRIIGGEWRRTKIDVLAHEGLRPSSDRVRETVFNWMTHQWGGVFAGKSVLDLFAGSGAFGLECISRGARDVVLIDIYRPAIVAMHATLAKWGMQADLRSSDALTACHELSASGRLFDWIVLDPPFTQGWLDKVIPAIMPLIHGETWLYVEVEVGFDLSFMAIHGWDNVREGKTKQAHFGLYRRTKA